MIVFSKARLVMLSVPKTGSTAYQAALAPLASMVVRDPPETRAGLPLQPVLPADAGPVRGR